jgi:hypothetical protein
MNAVKLGASPCQRRSSAAIAPRHQATWFAQEEIFVEHDRELGADRP